MAERTQLEDELDAAEGLLATGQLDYALELLERLVNDADEYISAHYQATEEEQWFSFPTPFERVAYSRVEGDPRELHIVDEPFGRLYADYALALVSDGDYDTALKALQQAVRWNPMECGYRLDLAELYRGAGNMQEYLSLSFSVFERASDVRHLIRAYCNFARHFESVNESKASAACLRIARKLDFPDSVLENLLAQAAGASNDPDSISDEEMSSALSEQGLPEGANAEVAAALLICATNAAREKDSVLATNLTVRARDLVGASAVKTLLGLIRQAEAEQDSAGDAVSEDSAKNKNEDSAIKNGGEE